MKKWLVEQYDLNESGVSFSTDNEMMKNIFDECEALCRNNIRVFGDYKCLIEGAKYIGIWLETQPMG